MWNKQTNFPPKGIRKKEKKRTNKSPVLVEGKIIRIRVETNKIEIKTIERSIKLKDGSLKR